MVIGMQLEIAAIKDGFPEGVWPSGLFQFLLEVRYLTFVFQGDDAHFSTKVEMSGIRSSITVTDA